jgi:hypothetical protein
MDGMKRALCLTGAGLLLGAGLLALIGPRCWPPIGRKSSTIARWKCKEYHDAALLWAKVRGELPARLEDMQAPLRPGEPEFQPVVDDPWRNPYVLEHDGTELRVRCVGPDGRAGTDDDVLYPEVAR